MSGFTDENYVEFTAFFSENRVIPNKKPYYAVADAMTPSVWFEATEVRECGRSVVSQWLSSPLTVLGLGDQGR